MLVVARPGGVDRAGRHVDDNGRLFVAGESDGDRIGAEHSFGAPERRNELGRVGHGPADQVALQRFQWIVTGDAEVIGVAHADPTGAVLLRFVHGDFIGLWSYDQTETVITVHRRDAAFLPNDFYLRLRIDPAQLEHFDIGVQARHAMGVDAAEIASQQNVGSLARIGIDYAKMLKNFHAKIVEILGREVLRLGLGGHECSGAVEVH